MKNYAINEVLNDVKHSLIKNSKLILQASPGAGKSTIVPLSLLKEPWLKNKMILLLEPRRVAVRNIASYMAKLLNEKVGETIGYQIKAESCFSKNTKILVITEGILTKKLQNNQSLDDVALVIFDEFHERSLNSDLCLAFCLQIQDFLRDDLKLLLMSATLKTKELKTLLNNCELIQNKSKIFEVEDIYLKKNIQAANKDNILFLLEKICLKVINEEIGDILVFLPGVKYIRHLEIFLKEKTKNISVLPLYSSLNKKEQDRALYERENRKIILSTNISQTSLTIEGVKIVIDSGYENISTYDNEKAMNHLNLSFISKDDAIQRGGRAGRISNGKCYKLWHENKILEKSKKAEILRSDLSALVLNLALWGVKEFDELKFLDYPLKKNISKTKKLLQVLTMLDKNFNITLFGKEAMKLGVHPRFAYMILKAKEFSYEYEACLLAALLEEKDILKDSYNTCDLKIRFMYLLEEDYSSLDKFKAKEIIKESKKIYKKLSPNKNRKKILFKEEFLAVLLLFAYPDRLAKRREINTNKYHLSNNKGALLNQKDTLFNEEFLVVSSLFAKERNSLINLALKIDIDIIKKYFFSYITIKNTITYNKKQEKFDFKKHYMFLNLELYFIYEQKIIQEEFLPLLLELIKKEGLSLLTWSKKSLELKQRVNFLNYHTKDLNYPDFSDNFIQNNIELFLDGYLHNIFSIKDLKNLDLYSILLNKLSFKEQKDLDILVPKFIIVPSNSKITVNYSNNEDAILSVKIQEVFGLNTSPKILNNQKTVKLELLSPAFRILQITNDLKSFWDNSYEEISKELRGKYKKHYWPKNPYDALATSKTKKNM